MAPRGAAKNQSGPRAGSSPGAVLTFVCLGQFMVFIDVSIVNLGLPSIQQALGMSDVSLNTSSPRTRPSSAASCCWTADWPTPSAAAACCRHGWPPLPRRRWSRAWRTTAPRWSPRPRCRS
jgi:hypothetical protein